jgi:hypothetical protein
MHGIIGAQSRVGARRLLSFDLKCMLVPMAAGSTSTPFNASTTPAACAINGYST